MSPCCRRCPRLYEYSHVRMHAHTCMRSHRGVRAFGSHPRFPNLQHTMSSAL